MAGTFKRITLKGLASDRPLLLSVVGLVEKDHGPLAHNDNGWKLFGVRLAGRTFSARITKSSIVVTAMAT